MKTFLAVCLLALLSACSDAVSPPPPPTTTPPPPEVQTVSVAFCDPYVPLWLAFQDGDGAWTRAAPTVASGSSVFHLTFAANRGAVATVLVGAPGTTFLQVLYGTPEELASVGINTPRVCGLTAVRTLLGTVAGVDINERAIVRGGFGAVTVAHHGEDFALDLLPAGPRDIIAARATLGAAGDERLTKFILRHGVDLPDGASLGVLDFDAPEAFAPVVANVTLAGAGVDGAFIFAQLRSATSENQFSLPFPGASGLNQSYYALPEAQLAAGDLQELVATAHDDTPNAGRSLLWYFRSPVDRTLEFGPDIIAPSFTTVATTPSLRIRAQFVPQDAYDREASIVYLTDGPSNVGVLMTAAYAALQGGYDLVNPELSGVAGFNPAWALPPQPSVRWSANRMGGTLGLGIDPVPTDGAIRRAAFATDVITP
jgi:hypothetical protein